MKLQKLTPAQFCELSTDVYDEVLRRKSKSNGKSCGRPLPQTDDNNPLDDSPVLAREYGLPPQAQPGQAEACELARAPVPGPGLRRLV